MKKILKIIVQIIIIILIDIGFLYGMFIESRGLYCEFWLGTKIFMYTLLNAMFVMAFIKYNKIKL